MYFWKLIWEKYTGSIEAGVLVSRPGPDLTALVIGEEMQGAGCETEKLVRPGNGLMQVTDITSVPSVDQGF